MKKKIVFLLTLLLTLTLAGAALANTEDRMKDMVQTYLDENGQDYVYDDYVFTLKLAIGSALEYADVRIFIYDDMLSVIADAPVQVSEENFEKMAIFTTLANNEIFYGQFRVDREYGYVSCRSSGGGRDSRRKRAVLSGRHAAGVSGNLWRRHCCRLRGRRSLRGIQRLPCGDG